MDIISNVETWLVTDWPSMNSRPDDKSLTVAGDGREGEGEET
jgi:hypothetical protein